MNIQRIRNLTTKHLHTKIEHVYEDVERLTGEPGVMTHQLPNAWRAMEPWLRSKLPERFFAGDYDPDHLGEYDLDPMTEAERAEFFERYAALPSLLPGLP